jgi:polysaccharide export outer membrane protein
MAEGRRNTIDLVSGVKAPSSVIMPSQNFTVLSALSSGGGVDAGLTNPQIKLMRGSHVYTTALQRLYDNPKLDTRLHGSDKIIVQADARYFLSLGATGQEAQFPFPRDIVSALDAMVLIGGVSEARADPKGVLILREYPSSAVRKNGPSNTRVVFTLDLTASDGLFSARKFHIQLGDLVLAIESPLANTQNVLDIIGATLGLARIAN